MAESQVFASERYGRIAVLRFERPPVNAIDLDAARQLAAAFGAAAADGDVGAIVLTGAGDSFCAGLDLKAVPSYDAAQQRAMINDLNAMVARLYGCPKPTVAAVNGHAIAGGLVLALACDRRIGTRRRCRIGLTEARVGIPFPIGPLTVVRAELDPSVARSLMLLARNLDDPKDAVRVGILDEVVPRKRLLERALEIAEDLASMPRDAYARIKQQLRGEAVARIEEAVARQSDPLLEGWLSGEAASASRAVLTRERRT